MPGKAQGGPARAGGGCGSVSVPEVIALREALNGSLTEEQQEVFQPRLDSLNQLIRQYEEAASAPSLSEETARDNILKRVKTEDVKAIVLPILRDLFDGRQGQDADLNILNCILDALTNDLPLTTLIAMVCRMYIKAFYNDNSLRMALGAAFVGSVGYLTWVNGMNQIVGLGREAIIIILSAMAQCAHIVNDAGLYLQTLNGLIGAELVGKIGTAINYLLPSAGGIFAMSNVYLMGLIYDRNIFPAVDDLLAADNSQAAAAAREAAAAAAAAAGGGVALAPLQSGPLPNNPAQPAAQAAAGVPGNSVFRQMYDELQRSAVSVGTHAKDHLVTLLRFATRIKDTRPGQLEAQSPEIRLYSSANVYATACVNNAFDMFNRQAGAAGISAVDVSAKHLLSACLPSEIRTGGELEAREEIFLLAHRIKSIVIDCLVTSHGMNRETAVSLLEEAFPVFSSGLTEANVDRFTASQLSTILRMLIKAADEHEFPVEVVSEIQEHSEINEASQEVLPPSTPQHVRLASIKDDLMRLLRLDPSVFRSPEEETQLINWVKANIGWLGSVIGMFDVSIGWVAQQARRSKLLQCGVQAVSSLGSDLRQTLDPGAAVSKSDIFMRFPDLRQKLPAIERFLTAPWIHVLNEITTQQAQGIPYDEIITDLCNIYGIPEKKSEFKAYIKALLLRVDLEFIITRGGDCSVQPNIVVFNKPDGTSYQAPVLTLSLPKRFMTDSRGVVIEKLEIPIECLKDPVIVPATLSQAIKGTEKAAASAAEAAAEVAKFTKNNTNKFIQWIGNVCTSSEPMKTSGAIGIAVDDPLSGIREVQKAVVVAEAEADTKKSTPTQTQNVIKSCCEQAPGILAQLVNQTDIVGAAAALVDLQPENEKDKEAELALLSLPDKNPSGRVVARTVAIPNESRAAVGRKEEEEEALKAEEAVAAAEEAVAAAAAAAAVAMTEEDKDAAANALKEAEYALEAANRNMKSFRTRSPSRSRGPLNTEGGKSRTRRRRPATAKRTRRKAYNKKSNKRKSRKQLSRRRQSRRK